MLGVPYHPTCGGSGLIEVSYADPENGPTEDPDDEWGMEYCECPAGFQRFYADRERQEKALADFLASGEV